MKLLISSRVAHKRRLLYTFSLSTRCPEVSTALKDALCTTQHVTRPSLLLHTRNEQQQGFFIKHVASDWSDGDTKANLLLWETDLCTAGSPSVVLETCETGGRIQGSPEELSWRPPNDVRNLMFSMLSSKGTLCITSCLALWHQWITFSPCSVSHESLSNSFTKFDMTGRKFTSSLLLSNVPCNFGWLLSNIGKVNVTQSCTAH